MASGGRCRSRPEGSETCLRAAECNGRGVWIYEANAIADHQIPAERTTLGYFLSRDYCKGRGKATLAVPNDITKSSRAEGQYVQYFLLFGTICRLHEMTRGDASGRGNAFICGFTAATAEAYAQFRNAVKRTAMVVTADCKGLVT